MGYVPSQSYSMVVASGATLSSQIDIGCGYNHMMLEIPTMASGTDVRIQGSLHSGGTFRPIHHRPTNSNDVPVAVNVDSSITNCMLHLEFVNARYLKIELTTAMTATSAIFGIVCQ